MKPLVSSPLRTPYDLLDVWLGERFGPKHVEPVIQMLGQEAIRNRLAEDVALEMRDLALPPKPAGIFRPYLSLRTSGLVEEKLADSPHLRFAATYAHAVVLEEYFLDSISSIGRTKQVEFDPDTGKTDTKPAPLEDSLEYARHHLLQLAQLRPLADMGVIQWDIWRLERAPHESWEDPRRQLRHWDLGESGEERMPFAPDWSGYPYRAELVARWGSDRRAFAALLSQGQWEIEIALLASARQRGDIFFGYPAVRQLFELEAREASRKGEGDPVERLVQLAVPDTGELTIRDIAAVRAGSEYHEKWRADLTSALAAADILGGGQDWQPRAHEIFADHLSASASALRHESSSRRAHHVAVDALRTFAFSAIGAGALVPLGSSALGIAGSAIGGAASAVSAWALSVGRRRRDRALLAHYTSVGGLRRR